MPLEVLSPGLLTTIQDRGRFGYYRYGIPQGGAMDKYSALIANRLVGNTIDEAVLEATYIGPTLRADQDLEVAITGSPVSVLVNGEPSYQNRRVILAKGDELSFGILKGGVRFYIAVAGGIDVPKALGSRSTYSVGRIGGFEGRALKAGDLLPVGKPCSTGLPLVETIPERLLPVIQAEATIRFMFGLYDHKLTAEARENLTNEVWTLTPVSDRTGLRFDGPGAPWQPGVQPFGAGQDPSNIVDASYAVGSIQIPGGTQPIVLHCDAVSGGGYAQAGTVISADMDSLSRLAPGARVTFAPVDMQQALAARARRETRVREIWS